VRVIQVRIVAAVAADELKHTSAAAFDPPVHEAGGLAPQDRGAAMTELSCRRKRGGTRGVHLPQPFGAGIGRSRRCGDAIPAVRRPSSTSVGGSEASGPRQPGSQEQGGV
jgi:hypothetical protein